MTRMGLVLAAACLGAPAALAQPTGQTSIPVSTFIPAITHAIQASGFSGLAVDNATAAPAFGTSTRTLATRFSDSLNVRDYGAKCDGSTDDQIALQNALNVATGVAPVGFSAWVAYQTANTLWKLGVGPNPSGGGHVLIPAGACYYSGQLAATAPVGESLTVQGAGQGTSKLVGDGGVTLAASDGSTSIMVVGLTIRHAGATQSGTGLTVSGPFETKATLRDVTVDGYQGTGVGGFQTGIHLVSVTPNIDGVLTWIPDSASGTATLASAGAGLVLDGGTSGAYLIDAKLSNSKFQGGYAGLRVTGPVQGVFGTNLQSLGNDIGFDWEAVTADNAELLTLTNFHANSHVAGVKAIGIGGVIINGGYFFRLFDDPTVSFHFLDVEQSSQISVIGGQFSGFGQGDTEDVLYAVADQQVNESLNTAYSLSGAMGDFNDVGSLNGLVTTIGNRISNHALPTKAMFVRNVNVAQPAAYQSFANCASDTGCDVDDNGSTTTLSHTLIDNANIKALSNLFAVGATFAPQFLPYAPGTQITLGDSGGAKVAGALSVVQNLSTLTNESAAGADFAPQFLPYTPGTPITLGDSGGANAAGVLSALYFQQTSFTAPATATSPCKAGIHGDGLLGSTWYYFSCIATNSWARTPLVVGGW